MQLLEFLFVNVVSLKSLGSIVVHFSSVSGVNAKYFK
jgi:hypothetical protein